MSDRKIEPCPFCGGECEASYKSLRITNRIRCFDCGYESPARDSLAEAIAAHNKVARNNAAADDLMEALEPFANFACDPPNECHNCKALAAIKKAKGEDK